MYMYNPQCSLVLMCPREETKHSQEPPSCEYFNGVTSVYPRVEMRRSLIAGGKRHEDGYVSSGIMAAVLSHDATDEYFRALLWQAIRTVRNLFIILSSSGLIFAGCACAVPLVWLRMKWATQHPVRSIG